MKKPFFIMINNTSNVIDLASIRNVKLTKSNNSFGVEHHLQVFDYNDNQIISETFGDLQKAVQVFNEFHAYLETN